MKRSLRIAMTAFSGSLAISFGFMNCSPSFNTLTAKSKSASISSTALFANGGTDGVEMILSPDLGAGINMKRACPNPDVDPACGGIDTYVIRNPNHPELASLTPVWGGAQWGSSSSVPATAGPVPSGFAVADGNKAITFYQDGRVGLAVNGENETGGTYPAWSLQRKWPHLILGGTITAPYLPNQTSGSLASMSAMNLNFDAHLIYQNPSVHPGWDPAQNAIGFTIYFTMQNLRQGDPDFGRYVWVGVPIYNSGSPMVGHFFMFDDGTQMLIDVLAYNDFASVALDSGLWTNFSRDLLPYAKDAINEAFQRGYLRSNDLSKFYIGGFNLGFENFGTNITTIEWKNFSLKVASPEAVMPPVTPPVAPPSIPTAQCTITGGSGATHVSRVTTQADCASACSADPGLFRTCSFGGATFRAPDASSACQVTSGSGAIVSSIFGRENDCWNSCGQDAADPNRTCTYGGRALQTAYAANRCQVIGGAGLVLSDSSQADRSACSNVCAQFPNNVYRTCLYGGDVIQTPGSATRCEIFDGGARVLTRSFQNAQSYCQQVCDSYGAVADRVCFYGDSRIH